MQTFTVNDSVENRRRFYFFLVDATDIKTPETGEAGGQPQISINGSTYANTDDVLNAIGNGTYYVTLTTTEISNLGRIVCRYKSANTAEFQDVGIVSSSASTGNLLPEIQRLLLELTREVNWLKLQLRSQDTSIGPDKELTVV